MISGPREIVRSLALTAAVYGGAGWAYIAGNAIFHPESLSWPLTHFLPFPREDTFGAACFAASVIGFLAYRIIKPQDQAGR